MRKTHNVLFGSLFAAVMVLAGCGVLPQDAATLPVSTQNSSTNVQQIPLVNPTTQQPAAPVTQVDTSAPAPTVVVQPPAPELLAQQDTFIKLYQKVSDAVVSVIMTSGGGSGFVIDPEGYIVTNNHVIAEGGPIMVHFTNGEMREAQLIGADPQGDIALIKVEAVPGELTTLTIGDSDSLQVGQLVVAIGSPFGLESTMTTGIVSGLSRALPDDGLSTGPNYQVPDVIQTDAAINPGNSGGPLLNLNGEVVGMNTAIESPVRANSGVGFAVPSNVIGVVVAQLRESGAVTYPWLGISGGTLSSAGAEELGLPADLRGVIISSVVPGGPADLAGLQAMDPTTGAGGDVVTAIDGRPIVEFDDLLGYVVTGTRVGQTIELTVNRDGQIMTLNLTLGARPDEPEVQQ